MEEMRAEAEEAANTVGVTVTEDMDVDELDELADKLQRNNEGKFNNFLKVLKNTGHFKGAKQGTKEYSKKLHEAQRQFDIGYAAQCRPREYLVILVANLKVSFEPSSRTLQKIEKCSRVTVEEIRGTRARVSDPANGWVTVTKDSRVFLSKCKTGSRRAWDYSKLSDMSYREAFRERQRQRLAKVEIDWSNYAELGTVQQKQVVRSQFDMLSGKEGAITKQLCEDVLFATAEVST